METPSEKSWMISRPIPSPIMCDNTSVSNGYGSSVANCPHTQLSFICNVRDPSVDCPYN